MPHQLVTLISERIAAGLKRKTITCCSKWTEAYRVMGMPFPGPWKFDHHPWTREMHDCDEDFVGMKAAQVGYTECGLNRTFYAIDVLGESVLYVLPASNPDASDFSASRFDPALDMSPHLRKMFSNVKNIGHKRAGNANLYIRGSRSRSQMKSIPTARIIFDELDEMRQENVTLALERTSGQVDKHIAIISTPTIHGFGVALHFERSSQDHFMFKCPRCGKSTELIFPECLVITADSEADIKIKNTYLQCKECKGSLEHSSKVEWLAEGQWVAAYTERMMRGFHINQLYSMTVEPWELAVAYLRGLQNPADETEFYNSKLGTPHEVEGARIKDADLSGCEGEYTMPEQLGGKFVTMGVDVGKWLHYEICSWQFQKSVSGDINVMATPHVVKVGKVLNFHELDQLLVQYGIIYTVIDANPERRKALEFAQRFNGRVKCCFYGRGVNGKEIKVHPEGDHTLTVDRTAWMDLALGRFKARSIKVPLDLPSEYKEQLKVPVRRYEKDSDGNLTGRYITPQNKADHFAHARTYCEIALQLAASLATTQNISGVL